MLLIRAQLGAIDPRNSVDLVKIPVAKTIFLRMLLGKLHIQTIWS
jgi:hypothetical protein